MKIEFIPGVHPSYKEQFDKLTEAYIKDEVNPYDGCACFVGNLLNNNGEWERARIVDYNEHYSFSDADLSIIPREVNSLSVLGINCINEESRGLYSVKDICALEQIFLRTYNNGSNEDSIFLAFEKTLELLKQIHISKGEIIEEEMPIFIKRKLQLV